LSVLKNRKIWIWGSIAGVILLVILIVALLQRGGAGLSEETPEQAKQGNEEKVAEPADDMISATYQNPVFEPVLADPSVIKGKDGYFYAYGTQDDWGDGEGARLVPIIRSKNLVNWEIVGEAFTEMPAWKDQGGIWAPDISFYNGKYYLYYSMSIWGDPNPGIGVATSDSPAGPFTDHGKLFTSEEIQVGNSIDPMLYVDEGTPYLFWGSFRGIYGIELSTDGFTTVGEKFQIAGISYEAPYIIKRDGYYYFFGSLGSCCEGENSSYRVAVARSKSLKGPYLDKDDSDIMYSEGTFVVVGHFMAEGLSKQFVGPGHNSIVRDDNGVDWIVYHGIDLSYPKLGNGTTRRPLLIDPLVWEDGWPKVKDLVPSTEPMQGPAFKKE
jgi:arabinan endo-1,5-alpha-L-arabinosidase